MGDAKRLLYGTRTPERMRFVYLMKKISFYPDGAIRRFADTREPMWDSWRAKRRLRAREKAEKQMDQE